LFQPSPMNIEKTLLCILLSITLSPVLHAQRRNNWVEKREIATDYNSCSQGVKDSTGKWVIPPKYDDVNYDCDYYIVSSGGKMGLLDFDGREVIPLIYDYLRPARVWTGLLNDAGGYYTVSQGGYNGIVDSVNHIIVPIRYLSIRTQSDSTFCCQLSKKTYDLYNRNGTCFHIPWKTRAQPQHEARHTFIIQKRSITGKKYGVVDDSGHIILERKYDEITGADETSSLCVEKGDKYGYCSLAGKWMWPMTLDKSEKNRYAQIYYHMPVNYGIGPAYSKGRWGLITITGETLLPFIYTRITPLHEHGEVDLWEVQIDSLIGVFDVINGWVLRPESTELTTIETFQTQDSTRIALLVARQHGMWGALTTNGQSVLPFRFEDMLRLSDDQFVFRHKDSLYYLGTTSRFDRSILIEKVTGEPSLSFLFRAYDFGGEDIRQVPDSKNFSVYRGGKGTTAFYNPAFTRDSVYVDSVTVRSLSTGKSYGMVVPDSILVSALFFVQPVTEPHMSTKLFDMYFPPNLSDADSVAGYNSFLVMHHKKEPVLTNVSSQFPQEHGYDYIITGRDDLIKTDGTMICPGDSIYSVEQEIHGCDGTMYFTMNRNSQRCAMDTNGRILVPYGEYQIGDFNNKYTWYQKKGVFYNWSLVNNETHLPVPGKKIYSDRPYTLWDSITIIENDKTGKRLFNADRNKYLTTYGFNAIIPLNKEGTLFAVKTCKQHVGVMDASGKYVLDTVYEAFTQVDADTILRSNDYMTDDYFHRFFHHIVFYNASASVMLNCSNGSTVPRKESLDLIWKETAVILPYENIEQTLSDSFFSYFDFKKFISVYLNETDSANILPWQKQCISDTLFSPARVFNTSSWYYQYPCFYCKNRGTGPEAFSWQKNYRAGAYFIIGYRSDSLLSFFRMERSYSWGDQFNKSWFSNVMLFPDGPHQMTLDSLFTPTSDWRNLIINTLINYVNTHLGIRGDCHNPAGIPSLLNEQFQFSAEGLLLYPPGFEENGEQLVLTVPWNEVDPYLRNDIKSRLPRSGK